MIDYTATVNLPGLTPDNMVSFALALLRKSFESDPAFEGITEAAYSCIETIVRLNAAETFDPNHERCQDPDLDLASKCCGAKIKAGNRSDNCPECGSETTYWIDE